MSAVVAATGLTAGSGHGAVPEAFWRSLGYFNLSRLLLAAVLLVAIGLYGDSRVFGATDPGLFYRVCIAYLLLSAAFAWALNRLRTLFAVHLAIHAVCDVIVITLLLHASGGIRSGLGILLLMPLAAAATLSGGRTSLFYASIATFALFVENTYWVLQYEIGWTDYFPVGMLAAGCFAVALVTNRLGKRLIANEALVRQRSEDLRNQIAINRLVIRDMPSGVLVVDADGKVRLANPEAERLVGRSGLNGLALDQLAPALEQAHRRLLESTGSGRAQIAIDGRGMHARLLRASGEHGGEVLIFLDDAVRLRAQAQQEKLAALGRLTANIAHEIRNPLSAIGHASQLLAEESRGRQDFLRLTRIIGDNTIRLDRIVQEVLQLNRRDRAETEEIALGPFLQGFLEQISQTERIDPASFVLQAAPGVRVNFDRQHLHRVLWNLVVNAWRHCRHAKASIAIVALPAGQGLVELHVVDDGTGVSEEHAGKLFEPFFTTEARGTGLGLYIARELAEANHAALDQIPAGERPDFAARLTGADFRLLMEGHVKSA
ncbi:MAG: PAS domain-containing protein [Burkholderiales bacterium]|nr:PAS domain-containing protein [Burkholderiales bacterium]